MRSALPDGTLPRRFRWTRARPPHRRRLPRVSRGVGRHLRRPSAKTSLAQLAATLSTALIVWGSVALFQTVFTSHIYPHISIDNVPVGGMTRDEALVALRSGQEARMTAPLTVRAADHTWQVTAAEFHARYDLAGAVKRAMMLDHGGPFLLGGWEEVRMIVRGANISLRGTHDSGAVASFLRAAAQTVHIPPRPASVGVSGATVAVLRRPLSGHQIAFSAAEALLARAIDRHMTAPLALPLQRVDSALGLQQARSTVRDARALLSAPIVFQWTAGTSASWQLKPASLLHLLTFTPGCTIAACSFNLGVDVTKLAAALTRGGVAASVDRAPIPASYALYTTQDLSAPASLRILPDGAGVTIDVASTARQVLLQGSAPLGAARIIFLPTLPVYPVFTDKVAQRLNFTTNVGHIFFSTPGLSAAYIANMTTASAVISNTIVAPGKTFDLAKSAGPFTREKGYVQGANAGWTGDVNGVNGGADGLAAVLLGAVYDAGLPVEKSTPYPYLNISSPLGLSSIVASAGGPDLVFRNTTGHPLLIMTYVDNAGGAGAYLFNSAGYAPGPISGSYSSALGSPEVAVNPDGSVDVTRPRTLTIGKGTVRNTVLSHSASIDP